MIERKGRKKAGEKKWRDISNLMFKFAFQNQFIVTKDKRVCI